MTIQITSRFDNSVLFEYDGANLRGANLRGANLRGAMGNMIEVISAQFEQWRVTMTKGVIVIGCQQHTPVEWWAFTAEEIVRMDPHAFAWWVKWKPLVRLMYETKFGE